MNTPRTIKSAISAGYVISNVSSYMGDKERVDLKPRFYKQGMKAILSFWVSQRFARTINPNPLLKDYRYPY